MNLHQSVKSKVWYNVFRNLFFDFYYKLLSIKYLFLPKKGVLLYLGLNYGKGFDKLHWQYTKAIGIEANPDLYAMLQKRYRYNKHIQLVHAAATTFNGEVTFNISDNHGLSSSLGQLKEAFGGIKMVKSVTVPAINLYDYVRKENIEFITDYVSDIQGNDLAVLKTMQPYIEQGKIMRITSEVAKDKYKNSYMDLPDNSESGFDELLSKNYQLVSKGWENLKENYFQEVPEDWWEMDCMWKLKLNQ